MMKRSFQLTILFCLSVLLTHAQGELWGVATAGGQHNAGVIYKVNADGTNFSIQKSFLKELGARPYYTQLTEGPDGKLYGMTREGGTQNLGVIFDFDPATGIYTNRFEFYDGATTGGWPEGSLFLADNGKFYGMTSAGGGGGGGDGALFEFDPVSGTYTKLHAFVAATSGSNPTGSLVQVDDGKLYGMTVTGGASNSRGVLFEYDITTATLTKRIDFNEDTNGAGCNPYGSLALRNGKLYGLTSNCGVTGEDGALFEFDPASGVIAPKFQFGGAEGGGPLGSLFLASNNKFYGVTRNKGTDNRGVLFEFDPDQGVNGTYTKKLDFSDAIGAHPTGSVLVEGDNSVLYGLTSSGGDEGTGVLFQYDYANNTYEATFSFTAYTGFGPLGSLAKASNGKFYGLTYYFATGPGVLFEYDPATGANGTYTVKTRLEDAVNGKQPSGELLEVDGKFYGTTLSGGAFANGVLFEYDRVTQEYVVKHHFKNALTGSSPSALVKADNGLLYGVTRSGGDHGNGTVFEFDPETGTLAKKQDFEEATTGHGPVSLVQASNDKLYGFSMEDEAGHYGLFEYDIAGDALTQRLNLGAMSVGIYPRGGLIEAENGKLYGLMSEGGVNNLGTLLEFDPASGNAESKFDFDGTNGSRPRGNLVLAANGKYYGTTYDGGSVNAGTLFEYDVVTNGFATVADFIHGNGANPSQTLTVSGNGLLYGTTVSGGANNAGVVFEFNPATQLLTKKHDFLEVATNGYNPSSSLMFLKSEQTITFNAIDPVTYGDQMVLGAATSSGLAVTFTSSDEDILTISGSNVTIHGAGTVTITAHQPGDAVNHPAVDVEQELVINKAPLTVAADVIRKLKNTADPILTYTITDGALVGNDLLEGSLEREVGEDFGEYDILVGTLASDNYEITFTGNTFTIHPRFIDKTDDIAPDVPHAQYVTHEWGDYDNDGDLDLLMTGYTLSSVSSYHTPPFYLALWRNGTTGSSGPLTEVTESVGLSVNIFRANFHFGDYDNDGDLDILLVGTDVIDGNYTNTTKIWRNDVDTDGIFVDVTDEVAPGVPLTGGGSSARWGDYDGDGDLDFALTGSSDIGMITQLWQNGTTGNSGIFTHKTSFASFREAAIEWVDYDNDGDLDLSATGLAGNGQYEFRLYRNGTTGSRGDFTNQTADMLPGIQGTSYAFINWRDIDNDGDADLLLTGNANSANYTMLWINGTEGTTGVFTDQTATLMAGIAPVHAIVPAWGDYDSDGDLDLFFAGAGNEGTLALQIWSNNDGIFTRAMSDEPVDAPRISYGAIDVVDYDNDGDLDLFTTGGSGSTTFWENAGPVENTAPTAPDNLIAATTAGGKAQLTWATSTDDLTAGTSITYNVRVGTSSGAIDIVSPNALADGTRTVVRVGNASSNEMVNLTALPPGTYYWSVQALDNGYAASEFSTENIFTVKTDQLLESEDTIRATYGDESFALEFASNSANEISYTSSEPSVATVVDGEVIIHAAGTTIITASQEEDNDFYEGSASQVVVVQPAILTITATANSKVYGEVVPALSYTATGFMNGDDESLLMGSLATSANETSPVGSYVIEQGTLEATNNYTIEYVAADFVVTTATLTVVADDNTKVYGELLPELTYTASGFVNGDDETILSGELFTTGYTVGEYVIEQGDLLTNDNYTISYTSATLTVTPATLTIGAYYDDIQYGDAIPEFTFYVSGFVGGDTQSILSGALSTTATATSGAGTYSIEQGSLTAGDNYVISYTPDDFVIHKAPLQITADNKSIVYGDAMPALTYAVSGLVHNDTEGVITGELEVPATSLSPAGEYYIVQGTVASENYNVQFISNVFTITKATLTVTADDKSKVYGDDNPSLTISYSGFVGDDDPNDIIAPAISVEANEFSSVGEYAIELSGGYATSYEFDFVDGTLQIEKKDLQIAVENTTKVYGDENPEITLVYSGFVSEDTFESITLPTISVSADASSNAGEYAIELSGGSADNYELELVNGTLLVEKRNLLITAEDKTRVYGEENPEFTLSYSGFANGDTPASLTDAPSLSVLASVGNDAGEYEISLNGGSDDNYELELVNGTLLVEKRDLLITAEDKTRVYGEENPELTYSISGLVNNDSEDIVTGDLFCDASATSSIGGYSISQGTITANLNYTIQYQGADLIIEKAVLTVSADNKTRTYGEENPELTFSYSGFVNGDTPASLANAPFIGFLSGGYVTSDAGEYVIVVSGGYAQNYEFDYVNGILLIEKRNLSILAENKTRKYGEQNPELTLVADGFVNGDALADITLPDISTHATVDSDAGEYGIQLTGGSATNYELQLTNGTLTVAKADQVITITSTIETKTVGDADFVIEAASSSGLALVMQSSNGRVTLAGNTVSIVSAGSETLTISHPGNPNYNAAESKTITFCINPAKPTITTDFTNADAPVLTSSATAGNQWYRNNTEIANATQQNITVSEQGSYTVIATVEGCSSVTSDEKAIVVTGVESESSSAVAIYPNPVQRELHLAFTEHGNKHVAVIGANGVTVCSAETEEQSLVVSMSDYTSGMYLVRVQTAAGVSYKRFIKK